MESLISSYTQSTFKCPSSFFKKSLFTVDLLESGSKQGPSVVLVVLFLSSLNRLALLLAPACLPPCSRLGYRPGHLLVECPKSGIWLSASSWYHLIGSCVFFIAQTHSALGFVCFLGVCVSVSTFRVLLGTPYLVSQGDTGGPAALSSVMLDHPGA